MPSVRSDWVDSYLPVGGVGSEVYWIGSGFSGWICICVKIHGPWVDRELLSIKNYSSRLSVVLVRLGVIGFFGWVESGGPCSRLV